MLEGSNLCHEFVVAFELLSLQIIVKWMYKYAVWDILYDFKIIFELHLKFKNKE